MQKMCTQKLFPDFILFSISPPKQPLHAKSSFKKIVYFERGLSKSLKTVNFIFFWNPGPFTGISYQKQKGLGTNDQVTKQVHKSFLLVIYHLTKFDGIIDSRF